MKKIIVNDKEYTLEFSFKSAENKEIVQIMFDLLTGAHLMKGISKAKDGGETAQTVAMINSTSDMVSDIPKIARIGFTVGIQENHNVTNDEAYEIMKQYVKENKITLKDVFDQVKECMEEDGFFELTGLTQTIEEMNKSAEKTLKKAKKTPQDHNKSQKKTSTSTK